MFWKILFSLGGGILLSLCPSLGYSQALPLEEVVAKVQKQYETRKDFKAQFVQETTVKSLGRKQQSEGTVYFKKPGKMRWTYLKPTQQEIISDGKSLWNYRPEDKQVVVSPMTQAFQTKTPSTFLAGIGNLQKDFKARFLEDPSSGRNYSLELTPHEAQGNLEKLFLTVDKEDFKILQARIQDIMGNLTQMTFSKIQFDNNLPDSLFTFIPPPGVESFNMPGVPSPGGAGR
jgi:outer membrane lipoprotein carrier protein